MQGERQEAVKALKSCGPTLNLHSMFLEKMNEMSIAPRRVCKEISLGPSPKIERPVFVLLVDTEHLWML